MVASKVTDAINAGVASTSSLLTLGCASSVPCSICFDLVIDDGDRSIAKLHCGHKFHLDCIGSAFNTKGTMQCPNCRKVESGRWLFAGGSADAISESEAQNWMPSEGPYDLSYSRRPSGFHWCPINGFTFHSPLEEADSLLNSFSNFYGNHAMITEIAASLASARSLNALSGPHTNLHATNINHPSWGWNYRFLPYSVDSEYIDHGNLAPVNPVMLRAARAQADAVATSPSFLHPLHYTRLTGESSVANSQPRERMQIFQSSYHQEPPSDMTNMPSSTNGFRRYGGVRSLPMVLPDAGQPEHHHGGLGRGLYIHLTGGSYNHAHERNHLSRAIIPGSYLHRVSRGSDFSNRNQWF